MKTIFALALVLVLGGCAGTQAQVKTLEHNGTIRLETSEDPAFNYKLYVKNYHEIGWEGDNKSDRLETAQLLLVHECKTIQVVDESFVRTGTYGTGREAGLWVMKIKCEKLKT